MVSTNASQLLERADTILAETYAMAIRDSRMTSYAEAFPDIAERFSTLTEMTLQWIRIYLPPETEAGRKLKIRLSALERATAVAYGAAASAIADWEGRQARPPNQLRDALEILLSRLWVRIGEAREAAPEPQEVIAIFKDPDAICVYCGETVTEASERSNFVSHWRAFTGAIFVGSCEHSFYSKDEWGWFSSGGARTRVVTFRQVCDLIAAYARFELGHDQRISSFSQLPFDKGWDLVFAWVDLGMLFEIDVDDERVDTATKFADVNLFVADQLGITV
jgi:hypothetical protein